MRTAMMTPSGSAGLVQTAWPSSIPSASVSLTAGIHPTEPFAGERAARSLGVPVRRTKLYALMLSATFTSIAGSLYAIKTGFVDPESGIGILVSVQMVIIAALGGAGSLYGPLVGAIILIPLQTATNTWFGGGGTGLTYILYGGIIVVIARFEPGGLHEMWQRIAPKFTRRRDAA